MRGRQRVREGERGRGEGKGGDRWGRRIKSQRSMHRGGERGTVKGEME